MLDTKTAGLADEAVAAAIARELARQQDQIELIASENIVSRDVLIAQGSVLTNKYAEGYPGKRYYGGCEFVDEVEEIARERLKQLFGAAHVKCARPTPIGFATTLKRSGARTAVTTKIPSIRRLNRAAVTSTPKPVIMSASASGRTSASA